MQLASRFFGILHLVASCILIEAKGMSRHLFQPLKCFSRAVFDLLFAIKTSLSYGKR